jgi:hypothetical protein
MKYKVPEEDQLRHEGAVDGDPEPPAGDVCCRWPLLHR